jgi:CHAT domain-containing protein
LLVLCTGDAQLSPDEQFQRVTLMFEHGALAGSQPIAAELAERYQYTNPEWSAQFRILEAQSAAWRGMDEEVLRILADELPPSAESSLRIRRLTLKAAAAVHLHRYEEANRNLAMADQLCLRMDRPVCGHVLDAHWTFAIERGEYDKAAGLGLQNLAFARKFGRPFDEATALANLANTSLYLEHFDEAVDWLNASNRIAAPLDARAILLTNRGNLGWAYYKLGDRPRALTLLQDAENTAVSLGDAHEEILWLTTIAYVLQDSGEWTRARESYRDALRLATQINSSEDIINSLESLARISIELGEFGEADQYLRRLDPLIAANANPLDRLDMTLARGRIAAGRHQDAEAEALFRQVEGDPASQISMRLSAEHQLARLYATGGRIDDALKMYAVALATFESARAQLEKEDSKLPYFANATPIYDDYIRLLIAQGKIEEALVAADQSRARTLEQGLGLNPAGPLPGARGVIPGAVAARTGATLLFYWLGEQQSWLWVITPHRTSVFPLPPAAEIGRRVERYRQTLLGPEDPLSAGEDGHALYRMLVAPAWAWLPSGGNVDIVCDGVLSGLNFETLIVPQPSPHYWIEDANIVSAPSLLLLASSKPEASAARNLLLIGNALSPDADYPELPNAGLEMERISRHFSPQQETLFRGRQANPRSYMQSDPQRYAYIDFVAHGIASRTDPLDSAIILSPVPGIEDSFRLHARDIMQHRIHARLVTIAACYGGGTRAYAGEGLVGLSWAFLYAGAHGVIGALWEVSDASTPLLMDMVYQGIEDGLAPGAALRRAKLSLLHGRFQRPFFWAPFQLYAGS